MKQKKLKINKQIIDEICNQPSVKKSYDQMTDDEKKYFRKMLVTTGIYQKYLAERNRKA